MEREIEIKILGYTVEEYIEMVEKIGAKFVKTENQSNYLLIPSDKKFVKDNEFVRIRKIDDDCELTLKKRILSNNSRTNEEYTVEFKGFDNILKIFDSLGIQCVNHSKYRIKYEYDGFIFDIDKWDENIYPFPYMEIEAENEEKLNYILDKLNIPKNRISLKSFKELIDEHKKTE